MLDGILNEVFRPLGTSSCILYDDVSCSQRVRTVQDTRKEDGCKGKGVVFSPLAGWLLFLTKFMNMNKQSWGEGEGVGKAIFFVRSGRHRLYTFLNKDCFGFISHSIFEVHFIFQLQQAAKFQFISVSLHLPDGLITALCKVTPSNRQSLVVKVTCLLASE